MAKQKINRAWFVLILLLLILLLAGCAGGSENAAASGKTYAVSEDLQQFYNDLGGEEVLGPAVF